MGVDANKVRLTGENSFLRLGASADAEPTTSNSHWRIVHSPKGPGHVLFTKGELTGHEPRVYSDNIDMARWLQEGVQASMGDQYSGDIPIIEADFWKSGDTLSFWTEYIESRDDHITLTWYDLGEPVMMANLPGEKEGQPHGVYSLLIPAARAQMTVNGVVALGKAHPRPLDDTTAISTCCIALSETWTIPRDHAWASA
ncbi:MAG: hypothetical protein F4W93_02970 [Dehalococcoidia bacterium]|nr:hypothetical protein [Dehalococcoidia bacterium]